MGKNVQPPAPPNYAQAAQQQGAANTEAARQSAFLSNPNIYTPYGSQTVNWGPLSTASTTPPGYSPYAPSGGGPSTAPPPPGSPSGQSSTSGGMYQHTVNVGGIRYTLTNNIAPADFQKNIQPGWTYEGSSSLNQSGTPIRSNAQSQPAQKIETPTRTNLSSADAGDGTPSGTGSGATNSTITDNLGNLQPTIVQTLNPTAQATLEQQQQAGLGLATTANREQGTIANLLATPYQQPGTIQQQLGNTGPVQLTPPTAQSQVYGAGSQYAAPAGTPDLFGFGQAQGRIAPQSLQQHIDTSGVAPMPVNAGTTGQQAIMSRLQPQLDLQRQQLHNQLTQQGLVPGDEAYNNAMRIMGQQQNDAQQQAVLQGIGLDLSANQQGFGQAATQGQFSNQAAQNQFGMGLQTLNQWNQALGQNQQTALAQQQADNQARSMGFANAQAMQQAQNVATQGNFQNQLTQQQAYNQALGQSFNQGLSGAQFGNAAQQQLNAQQMQVRDLPLNEIAALMSGSQVQNPQFQAYSGQNIQAAPIFQGAQNQAAWDQNVYNQRVAQANATTSGLFGLGGGLLGGAGAAGGFGKLFGF